MHDPHEYSLPAALPNVTMPDPVLPSLIDTMPVEPLVSMDDIDWFCDVTTVQNNMNGSVW
jgi:hypothetical protein